MVSVAFKEWSSVCRALAVGRQSLILRKGGIADEGGLFRPEHETFLLLPTYFHEPRAEGLKPEWSDDPPGAEGVRPEPGRVTFRHVVSTTDVIHLRTPDAARRLDAFHVWSQETVEKRFHYRAPGLFALVVRTRTLPAPVSIPDDPSYAGCKSWVPLTTPVAIANAIPVLDDESFRQMADAIRSASSSIPY
jgi:hypothetical protein